MVSGRFQASQKTSVLDAEPLGGTVCDGETFACLGCGFVWSSLSAQNLIEFIAKECKTPEAVD